MHDKFPHMPFYVAGKEISLEDVRLTLQKMADRFFEHPATVLVLTNLNYSDAPWLAVKSMSAASSMVWNEVRADRQHVATALKNRSWALKASCRMPGRRA